MNSVGVATGGGAGMALARCMTEGAPPMDLHEADPKRFPACFNSAEALAARVPEVLGKHYEITYPGRQWASGRNLESLPLHDRWVVAKAHFGQFFGIERPLYFGKNQEPALTFGKPEWFEQVGREVASAHEAAAIFDQSSFGKIRVQGAGAEAFLNRVCANDMGRPPGRAIYTAMLNAKGGLRERPHRPAPRRRRLPTLCRHRRHQEGSRLAPATLDPDEPVTLANEAGSLR